MHREMFSNAQLPAHERVLANDEKIRAYRLPEFSQIDALIPDSHREQLNKVLFHRVYLTMFIHASTHTITHIHTHDLYAFL
jgi:hypothetical protein